MSHVFNGNGGFTTSGSGRDRSKPAKVGSQGLLLDASTPQVVFENSRGEKQSGVPLRITRHAVVFELYSPEAAPQYSEVFSEFRVGLSARFSYSGRAVVRTVTDAGTRTICEVALDEHSWTVCDDGHLFGSEMTRAEFNHMLKNWQSFYRVNKDYKEVISDLHSFMTNLHSWLNRVELRISILPAADQTKVEEDTLHGLRDSVLASMNGLFGRFEDISNKIEEEIRPAHRAFGQRLLHPFMLSSPFLRRTYTKPLGYAGDYEMMNMIVRNRMEGDTLFGKLANAYLLAQAAPQAVRNRVGFLRKKIIEETRRVVQLGRTAKIYSIACGPAWEVVNFLEDHPLADRSEFQLLDFDSQTLHYVKEKTAAVLGSRQSRVKIKTVKNSVQNLLLRGDRVIPQDSKFDLIYCSGLYDYLNDRVCRALNDYLYNLLLPGGLMVVGNFNPSTPDQNTMEHFAEWFLIYRDSAQLAALAPRNAPGENCVVRAEPSGTNIFLEVRKDL